MAIEVLCGCGKRYRAQDQDAGKTFVCRQCGQKVLIAAPLPSAAVIPVSLAAGAPSPQDEDDVLRTLAPRPLPPAAEIADTDPPLALVETVPPYPGDPAAAQQASLAAMPIGYVLDGRYIVTGRLGGGGMGSVYKVVNQETATEFAVKVLTAELVHSSAAMQNLKREVATASKLTHQNLLRVNHLGLRGNEAYLVMEFIDGEDLETYRRRKGGSLSEHDFCRLVPQLLAGLEFLHERGVVHLDIKPQNIMVTPAGEVKITDFGISRSIKEQVQAQGQQPLTGTVCFMAPEQFRGKGADRRTDIYALGVMFHLLLSGEFPFPMRSAAEIQAWHLGPSANVSRVPAPWRPLVSKCLARQPSERFRSCEEIRQQVLEIAQAPQPAEILEAIPAAPAFPGRAGRPPRGPCERSIRPHASRGAAAPAEHGAAAHRGDRPRLLAGQFRGPPVLPGEHPVGPHPAGNHPLHLLLRRPVVHRPAGRDRGRHLYHQERRRVLPDLRGEQKGMVVTGLVGWDKTA